MKKKYVIAWSSYDNNGLLIDGEKNIFTLEEAQKIVKQDFINEISCNLNKIEEEDINTFFETFKDDIDSETLSVDVFDDKYHIEFNGFSYSVVSLIDSSDRIFVTMHAIENKEG